MEVAGNDEPEAIIWTLIADNVDIHGVCIQGGHRLAPCDILGDDKHHMVHDNRMLGP